MKKVTILFVLLLIFFVTGCSSKNTVVNQSSDEIDVEKQEVSLNYTTFPIESSEILNLFRGYSFYDTLHIVVINQVDELQNIVDEDKAQTLYLLDIGIDESESIEQERVAITSYRYGKYLIIYQGENAEIQTALTEKLSQ